MLPDGVFVHVGPSADGVFASVWRALTTPIQDTPLALCDARTVGCEDLVPMDIVYPHFADEVYEVRFNKSHRWFYKQGMKTDDVAIFNLHDTHSKDTGK